MHNMVMTMKADRESAGIRVHSAQLQEDFAQSHYGYHSQPAAAMLPRPDTTTRISDKLNASLAGSAKSSFQAPCSDAKFFASSAFKKGPAATNVPLPSRLAQNIQSEDAAQIPITSPPSPISSSCPQMTEIGTWPGGENGSLGAASRSVAKAPQASSSQLAQTLAGAAAPSQSAGSEAVSPPETSVASDLQIPTKKASAAKPAVSAPAAAGPSPSAVLRPSSTVLGPSSPSAVLGPKASKVGSHGSGTRSRKPHVSSATENHQPTERSGGSRDFGANAISDRPSTKGGKKTQSASISHAVQSSPPARVLPGSIKLPPSVAKLLPDSSPQSS